MPRRLPNWLEAFKEWTLPRSESPESVLEWCGLYTLASVMRRHVKVPKEYLGGWECYPSLYVLFVAPQGQIKKSTSIAFVEDLLDEITDKPPTNLIKSPDAVSVPDLLQRLQNADESSVYILSSEFSTLVNKAGLGIYDILTDLYDGKKKIDEGTISRGYIFASSPCLNLLAATTPKWVGANMSEDIIGGGFGSRVIYIFEDTPRQRRLYYNKITSQAHLGKLRDDLINDLSHISSALRGEFRLTEEAQDFMDNERGTGWYNKNAEAPPGTDSKLIGYYQRRPAHIHKVAMLLHAAREDSLVLDVNDFEDAIALMYRIEPKIANTFKAIGRNVYVLDMQNMVRYIKEQSNGLASRTDLLRVFNTAAEPNKMDELITHLIQLETIKIEMIGQEMFYKYVEDLD